MDEIRIVLVEDSELTRVGLGTMLARVADFPMREMTVLQMVAEDKGECKDGACLVDSSFFARLHRFSKVADQ